MYIHGVLSLVEETLISLITGVRALCSISNSDLKIHLFCLRVRLGDRVGRVVK